MAPLRSQPLPALLLLLSAAAAAVSATPVASPPQNGNDNNITDDIDNVATNSTASQPAAGSVVVRCSSKDCARDEFYAMAFTLLFAVLAQLHLWRAIKYSQKWCWIMVLAGAWETYAFASRTLSFRGEASSGAYLMSESLMLLAPFWVGMVAFVTLGQTARHLLPRESTLRNPIGALIAVLLTLSVLLFAIQLTGRALLSPATPAEAQARLSSMFAAVLALQGLLVLYAAGLGVALQREMARCQGARSLVAVGGTSWGMLLFAVYYALAMVLVRIGFRLRDHFVGAQKTEISLYMLDGAPMFLALLCFFVIHPGMILDLSERQTDADDGEDTFVDEKHHEREDYEDQEPKKSGTSVLDWLTIVGVIASVCVLQQTILPVHLGF